MKPIDLSGKVFGKWTVLARAENSAWRATRWSCRCSCGTEAVVDGYDLRRGHSTRCRQCGYADQAWTPAARKAVSARKMAFVHGLSRTPEYISLASALGRCRNPRNRNFSDYGGRGVEYRMPEDLGAATRALIAAIGPRPDGMTLDRIDNDGHYEIGNLRWATRAEQVRNQRQRRAARQAA